MRKCVHEIPTTLASRPDSCQIDTGRGRAGEAQKKLAQHSLALTDAIQLILKDAQDRSQKYLDEVSVPHGGE